MIVFAAGHLRSAVARNALGCMQQVLSSVPVIEDATIRVFIPALLRSASDDKRFLREAAQGALEKAVEHHGSRTLVDLLFESANHPNALIQETVCCGGNEEIKY